MKTQYYTASSLDGFIATEDHSLDWLFPLGDIAETGFDEFFAEVGALAMGSHTFEWLMSNHVLSGTEDARPWPYEQPAWIFSSRDLTLPESTNTKLVRGDVRTVHKEMLNASNGKNLWIVGGGDLAAQFYDAGLLDEIIVQIGSTTLAKGMPLFPRSTPTGGLKLRQAKAMGEGFAELRYEIDYGRK